MKRAIQENSFLRSSRPVPFAALALAALLVCAPGLAQTYFVDAAFGDDGFPVPMFLNAVGGIGSPFWRHDLTPGRGQRRR